MHGPGIQIIDRHKFIPAAGACHYLYARFRHIQYLSQEDNQRFIGSPFHRWGS
jgi:hypothetical protein